jgi:hypothetical protein
LLLTGSSRNPPHEWSQWLDVAHQGERRSL